MSAGSWIRGDKADKIIQMAAAGTMSKIIGEETGHRVEVIDNFISRHRVEVEALKLKHAMKLDAYWLTVKAARIAKAQERHMVLSDQFHDLAEELHPEEEPEADAPETEDPTPLLIKLSDALLRLERQTGEESGQLLTRLPNPGPDPAPVKITIERPDA